MGLFSTHISTHPGHYLAEEEGRRLFAGLVSAIGYLHRKRRRPSTVELGELVPGQKLKYYCYRLFVGHPFRPKRTNMATGLAVGFPMTSSPRKWLLITLTSKEIATDMSYRQAVGVLFIPLPSPRLVIHCMQAEKADIWSCGVVLVHIPNLKNYPLSAFGANFKAACNAYWSSSI